MQWDRGEVLVVTNKGSGRGENFWKEENGKKGTEKQIHGIWDVMNETCFSNVIKS